MLPCCCGKGKPWNRLFYLPVLAFYFFQVIDSSDVVVHVLDARDPLGTRCPAVEKYIKHEAGHKHLIFVLNKCDLVPTWVSVSHHGLLLFQIPQLVRTPDGLFLTGFSSQFGRMRETSLRLWYTDGSTDNLTANDVVLMSLQSRSVVGYGISMRVGVSPCL
jgi:hypothetical protein